MSAPMFLSAITWAASARFMLPGTANTLLPFSFTRSLIFTMMFYLFFYRFPGYFLPDMLANTMAVVLYTIWAIFE